MGAQTSKGGRFQWRAFAGFCLVGVMSLLVGFATSASAAPRMATVTRTAEAHAAPVAGLAKLSGTVRSATAAGAGVPGVCVAAIRSGASVKATITGPTGAYSFADLVSGTYRVEFRTGCGLGDSSPGERLAESMPFAERWVTVRSGGAAAGIDAVWGPLASVRSATSASGSISGTVTSAKTGKALGGICVGAIPQEGGVLIQETTNAKGVYAVPGLAPGAYSVGFSIGCGSTGNYLPSQYPSLVQVKAGKTTTGINAALGAGGAISGTVTAAKGGNAIGGICVGAFGDNVGFLGQAVSVADGTYALLGVPTGTYEVNFEPGCGSTGNYAAYSVPNPVSVTAGSTTKNVDAALSPGGVVTGEVTAQATGKPLGDICVSLSTTSGNITTGYTVRTSAAGTYRVADLATADYDVAFSIGCGSKGNYAPYQYPTPVAVTAGVVTQGVDAALSPGGTISGQVWAAAGGKAIPGICVSVSLVSTGMPLAEAQTGSNGTYTAAGLPAGSFNVGFDSACGSTTNYAPATYPKPVVLAAGQATSGIDIKLQIAATITGKATSGVDGKALGGICVGAFPPGVSLVEVIPTGPDGTYSIGGLAPGTYTVGFSEGCGNRGNYAFDTVPDVVVAAGQTVANVDGVLAPGGTITGTVTAAAGGLPVSGICINAVDAAGNAVAGSVSTGNGTYLVKYIGTGTYTVTFADDCGGTGNYAPVDYPHPVSVTAGETTKDINAALPAGGSITGTVTAAAGGAPIAGICVEVLGSDQPTTGAYTAADGTYDAIGLGSGSYTVKFFAGCGSVGSYAAATYPTPVAVTAGQVTDQIDIALKGA